MSGTEQFAADARLRARVAQEARLWLGTPYRHQASRRGAGCDCLGLLIGVWRSVYGALDEAPPPYTPDWSEFSGRERLLEAARRRMIEIRVDDAAPGDALLFRMRAGAVAKHVGVVSGPGRFVHAYSGRGVVETALAGPWAAKVAAAFRFPAIDPSRTD